MFFRHSYIFLFSEAFLTVSCFCQFPVCIALLFVLGEKVPVDQTNIPAHLEQMLVLLQQEEDVCEKGMYGPCLEYLLQHKLLDTLYSLGRTDVSSAVTCSIPIWSILI